LIRVVVAFFVVQVLRAAIISGSDGLRIFISHTYYDVGKVEGHWRNFDDARWAHELSDFLDEMNRLGKGKADLFSMATPWNSGTPWTPTIDDEE
jgi:hypothetical protein